MSTSKPSCTLTLDNGKNVILTLSDDFGDGSVDVMGTVNGFTYFLVTFRKDGTIRRPSSVYSGLGFQLDEKGRVKEREE